jgi:DNA modification methylase
LVRDQEVGGSNPLTRPLIKSKMIETEFDIKEHLQNFVYNESNDLFYEDKKTKVSTHFTNNGGSIPTFINEFWTAKQRQANSIHEISYRACFKPQLPRFFVDTLTKESDFVYDPFAGRGTTIIESALLKRQIVANDINPLSEILCCPRLSPPSLNDIFKRIEKIPIRKELSPDIDLLMFYHQETLTEILSLREYLCEKRDEGKEDDLDSWIRMVATNRLTGHSKGFFSVYTLPPNQAVSPESQVKINEKRKQKPEYRDTKKIIFEKTRDLIKTLTKDDISNLLNARKTLMFLKKDARETYEIPDNLVQLTVTSPPFLDVVQYSEDNWLRCWFNYIDADEIGRKITNCRNVDDWVNVMTGVFVQLYRITKSNGFVAYEVGEVKNDKIKLDHYIVEIGTSVGFICEGTMINEQQFTKTANIWGISNNEKGTNTNRIVIFKKD